jgi:predicted transposase YbfD/YdcC
LPGETARLIEERGGKWVFTLKANRPVQHAEVKAWFADPQNTPHGEYTTTDADNSRIEVRRHVVTRGSETTAIRRLYLSSTAMGAVTFAAAVRAHWRIENCLHWVLDVGFDEDRARNRCDHGPKNLTILRKLALNVLRSARQDISIRRKRKRSGWSDAFARSGLGQMR